ncbi:MAG: hypothetical protein JRN13_06665 [Nitrososphaerota archaeon]|nr:hypothetical protein [Nitrososphaerota archaeon]MDG6974128.1 hypothetical protein [Nitrososphaerota archaeon]MDG6987292.1 hypothetical protein [Nitrososphaerota archaeon]MDG7015424.1 hypothetical protein [Nitrososphaerota archaeon]WGO50168.1 MAG: hypothetical protein JRM93_04885 [Nitrososphaerota archaeon]
MESLFDSRWVGPIWFSRFRERLWKHWREQWGSGAQYTKAVLDFLEDMGKEEGCSVEREKSKRDMVWLKGDRLVAHIEHENNGDDWDYLREHEIEDLLRTDARLKVLITYVRKNRYPVKEYSDGLGDILREREGDRSEYLLVVAPWHALEAADFVAHYWRPSYEHELLVRPSGGNS